MRPPRQLREQETFPGRGRAPAYVARCGPRRPVAPRYTARECSVKRARRAIAARFAFAPRRHQRRLTQERRHATRFAAAAARVALACARMHLSYALLALLGEGEAHGYQLLKRFSERVGPFWHPNIGQVYQLLRELERRGLVARRDEDSGT